MATGRPSATADRIMHNDGGSRPTGEGPPSEPARVPPRHRSHAPSPFLSPRSSAKHAQKAHSSVYAPRHARELAPSAEPERARLPGKLHKIEEDAPGGRNALDAQVLASLFGSESEDGDEITEREQHLQRTGQPESLPSMPLHRTRPHLDDRYREASHDTTISEFAPVAGPSGLRRATGRAASGSVGIASSEDERDGSRRQLRTSRMQRPDVMYDATSTEEESDESHTPVPAKKRYIQRDGSASSRKRRRTARAKEKSIDEQVNSFLSGLDLPEPKYRPLGVKARLANELAERTSTLPPGFRVDHVALADDDPDGGAQDNQDGAWARDYRYSDIGVQEAGSAPRVGFDAGLSIDWQAAASAAEERAASPADSLPDYEDQEPPEMALVPKYEEVELVAAQPYFDHPTRRGAIDRWAGLLETRAQDLPVGFAHQAYLDDVAKVKELENTRPHHGTQPIPIPSENYVPPRDFQFDPGRKILSIQPSDTVNAALWEKLLSPSHDADHSLAPGQGRKCTCPLWVPSSRPSFEVELKTLSKKRGIALTDLIEVLEAVFPSPDACKEPREMLLRKIHESSWLWFAGLEELATIRKLYVQLASQPLIEAIALAVQALFEQERIEIEPLERELARVKALPDAEFLEVRELTSEVARKTWDHEKRHAKRLGLLDRLRSIAEREASVPVPSGREAARAAVEAWRRPDEAPPLSGI